MKTFGGTKFRRAIGEIHSFYAHVDENDDLIEDQLQYTPSISPKVVANALKHMKLAHAFDNSYKLMMEDPKQPTPPPDTNDNSKDKDECTSIEGTERTEPIMRNNSSDDTSKVKETIV